MSEYKGIKGFQVQTRTEDPTPYAQALADNPYAGAWSSVASMNTATDNLASLGTTTNAMGVGGNNPPISAKSETWDGSSWTEGNDLNTARSHMHGAGIYTSAVIAGGEAPSNTNAVEKYNGTSWTTSTNYPTSKASIGGLGASNTAAVFFGGAPTVAETYEFDGTNWTETNDMNTGRNDLAAAGTQTAGIAIGGNIPPRTGITETYNGSTWTEVGDMNTAKNGLGASTQGSTTSALAFGGSVPPGTALTESWDGTSWTEVADLATARYDIGGSGTGNTSALAFAGGTPPRTAATEEWSFSGLDPSTTPAADYADAIIGDFYYNSSTGQFKNVSSGVGSWASGGNLNGGRYGIMGAGTLTAGLAMGGTFQPSDTTKNTAETYNGISWTNAPTLPGNIRDGGSWGVQTSAVQVGGSTSPGATPFGSTAYEFDGSSFSNGGSLNTARRYNAGAGAASTAGITFGGGNPGPYVAITESYDGSTFTEVADLNTARNYLGAAGTQTAAIAAGGNTGSDVANVELWDGSSWTETTDINTARGFASPSAGMGSQTAAIVVSGNPNNVESWDGTSWTEIADLGTSRSSGHTVGFNSTSAGMYFGGSPNSYATYTEEWDQPSFQIKSVTTS
jgi:hypothetical protein